MLRHMFGLLAGLLCTPLLWVGAAWSAAEIGTGPEGGNLDSGSAMPAVAALLAIGVLGGVLVGARISPLAAFLSGGLLLGFCLWPLLDPASLNAALPGWLDSGSLFHPLGPALPVTLPLGTLLFFSALFPSRWRSAGAAYAATTPPPAYEAVPDSGYPPVAGGYDQRPYPSGPAPETEEPGAPGYGDSAKSTTPFQRDPRGGAPRPAWTDTPPDPASQTRVFREEEDR